MPWPLIVFVLLVAVVTTAMIAISFFLGERHHDRATGELYESGIRPAGSVQVRIPIQYVLLAMLFVLFDLEAVFLYLWAVALRAAGWPGYAAAAFFIAVLLLALWYVVRNGVFSWTTRRVKP
jgi:NADH-quinone oxidoreductase subunit A